MARDEFYESALAFARRHGYKGADLPKGKPGDGWDCTMAHALGHRCGYLFHYPSNGLGGGLPLPEKVAAFVARFDAGDYPELIEETV